MHYKINVNTHLWEEKERPFRKYWVRMLELVGEKAADNHDLPKLHFHAIKDSHEFNQHTFKPEITKSKSLVFNIY